MALQELQKEYGIHVYETGPDGRLRLCSLFDYMQDLNFIMNHIPSSVEINYLAESIFNKE